MSGQAQSRFGNLAQQSRNRRRISDYKFKQSSRPEKKMDVSNTEAAPYSTVTLLARLRGLSTSQPRSTAQ
jgi:hypothetical protein